MSDLDARRPHILVFNHIAQLSGGEIALVRLVSALAPTCDLTVVLGEDGPLGEKLASAGAQVEVVPLDPRLGAARRDEVARRARDPRLAWALVRHVVALRRLTRERQPDLVQTNSLKAAVYGGIAGRLSGVPVVWHLRDRLASDYLSRRSTMVMRLLSRLVPQAVVANSQATITTLPRSSRPRRAVIHDPLPPAEASQPDRTRYRVGVVGRLAPWKGQDVFLRAFARAFGEGDEIAVLVGSPMFGEEGWETALHQLAVDLDIAERVEFRGFREDVPAELARLSALVHCSVLPEPFGQVIIEGMAAGLPVVAAAAGGPLEIVEHDRTGLLTRPGDVEELALAMRGLRESPGRAAELGLAGQRSVHRFASERIAAEMMALYRKLA